MENQIVALKYGKYGFGAQAKNLIKNGNDFSVLFYGWRAKAILSSLPILMHMQGAQLEDKAKFKTSYVLSCFCRLILMSNFMVIFWLAVANNIKIHLETNKDGLIELAFRSSSMET